MPYFEFLLRGMSYPRLRLGCQCELFVVCVYVFCLVFHVIPKGIAVRSSPTVLSTLLLFALSKLWQARQKCF